MELFHKGFDPPPFFLKFWNQWGTLAKNGRNIACNNPKSCVVAKNGQWWTKLAQRSLNCRTPDLTKWELLTETFGRLFICVAVFLFVPHHTGESRGGGSKGHILQKEGFFFMKTFLREPSRIKICFLGGKTAKWPDPPLYLLSFWRWEGGR